MRTYAVQPGDTPSSIAAKFAGCPKCVRDLVSANPIKLSVTYPNGYVTFQQLQSGEYLNLPDKWFNGMLDQLPQSYFEALPGPMGMLADFNEFALGLPPGATVSLPSALPPGYRAPTPPSPTPTATIPTTPPPGAVIQLPGPTTVVTPQAAQPTGMSTATKVAIGVGAVAAAGLAWWALS